MLNKTFKAQIVKIIHPLTFKDLKKYTDVIRCCKALEACADIKKFAELATVKERAMGATPGEFMNIDLKFHKSLAGALTNDLYGGSVFKGIQEVEPNTLELRNLKNGLLEDIIGMRNNNAGFFRLLNVRMTIFAYCDIEILVEERATKMPGFDKMLDWHRKCVKDPAVRKAPGSDNSINAAEFEQCLTGIGRIIYYRKNSNDDNFKVIDLIEGRFNQGFVDGFARHIEVRNKGCDILTNCKVGFWSK
jgi:hypothetical protein